MVGIDEMERIERCGSTQSYSGPFISYAQNFEDVMLWRALGSVSCGQYIDVGAGEPDADSVTKAFYDRGWRGLNIEPLQKPFERLKYARRGDVNLNIAVGASSGEARFNVIGEENALSTLSSVLADRHRTAGWRVIETIVRVSTLKEICADHVRGEIHFLKIDAEGWEFDVLKGADFKQWRPWIIILETPNVDDILPSFHVWEQEILDPCGYLFVWFDGLNRFYVASERKEILSPAFCTPPNLFDNFVRASEFKAIQDFNTASDALNAADSRTAFAQEQADHAQARVAAAEARADEAQARVQIAQEELDSSQARVAAAEMRAEDAQARVDAAQSHISELTSRTAKIEKRLIVSEEESVMRLDAQNRALSDVIKMTEDLAISNKRMVQAINERNVWAQELFESNRYNSDLTRVRQKLIEEIIHLKNEVSTAKSNETFLLQNFEESRIRINELLQQVESSISDKNELQQKNDLYEEKFFRLESELEASQITIHRQTVWIDAIRASSSWQITRPLRVIGRFLGRKPRR